MDDSYEQSHQLRVLAMRISALEDNVAFLEEWCEEQQDALDRAVGPATYDYALETSAPPPRAVLRIVDLRDAAPVEDDAVDADAIFAIVETDHDKRIRHLRRQLNRLRTRLAETLAPPDEDVSVKPAGRTAP
jgi:hypothetical protein